MLYAILGIIIGILVGIEIPLQIPPALAQYTAVVVLAIFDSLIGAVRANTAGEYDTRIFLSGLIFNMIVAGAITYLGDQLGLELYLGVIIVFTFRMFENLAKIRYFLLEKGGGVPQKSRTGRFEHVV